MARYRGYADKRWPESTKQVADPNPAMHAGLMQYKSKQTMAPRQGCAASISPGRLEEQAGTGPKRMWQTGSSIAVGVYGRRDGVGFDSWL